MRISFGGYTQLQPNSRYILFISSWSETIGARWIIVDGKYNIDGTDRKEAQKMGNNQRYRKFKEAVMRRFK